MLQLWKAAGERALKQLQQEGSGRITQLDDVKSDVKIAVAVFPGSGHLPRQLRMLGWQVNLILIGHIGAKELGASAMARMWMGMSAYAILFGGMMSLDTLRSQAFGAKNYELVGILTPENFASVLTRIRAAGKVAAAQ